MSGYTAEFEAVSVSACLGKIRHVASELQKKAMNDIDLCPPEIRDIFHIITRIIVEHVEGVPDFLQDCIKNVMWGAMSEEGIKDDTIKRAGEIDALMNFVLTAQEAKTSIRDGLFISDKVISALDTYDFQHIMRAMNVDVGAMAQLYAPGGEADAVEARWESMLFRNPPFSTLSSDSAIFLDKVIKSLRTEDNDFGRTHAYSGGACGLWASVLNRVLETGGQYIVCAGRGFIPDRHRSCHHVALRVGDFIVDGLGVHKPGDFLREWKTVHDCMHELHQPEDAGLIGLMKEEPIVRRMLDENALESDMRSAGLNSDLTITHRSSLSFSG